MVVSWILILFFLMVIIGEMYLIGKYISVTQEIFSNKIFAIFALGAAIYIFIAFVLLIPFVTFGLSLIYFAIITIIKDFFTIIFLITRREKFKGMIINWKGLFFVVVATATLPVIGKYVMPNVHYEILDKKYEYQTWTQYFIPAFTELTKFTRQEINEIFLAPIASLILYSSISALYFTFYKRSQISGCIISLGVTVGFLFIFNNHLPIYYMIGPALIIVMFLTSYHLVMFSRRRYGTLFGILVAAIWSVQPQLFWTTIIFAFATSLTYSALKRPKALTFTVQLIVPVLIVAALWVGNFSKTLGITLAIFGVIAYILIFTLNRFQFLESNSKWVSVINYAWPIASIITIASIALAFGLTNTNVTVEVLYKNNNLFETFNKDGVILFQNIAYYVIFAFLGGYTIYGTWKRKRFQKFRLVIIITLFTFLFGFNPAFQIIMMNNNSINEFFFVRYVAVAPLIIVLISQINLFPLKIRI